MTKKTPIKKETTAETRLRVNREGKKLTKAFLKAMNKGNKNG